MVEIKWRLKNIETGAIHEINSSVFSVGRNTQAQLPLLSSNVSRSHSQFLITREGDLHIQDSKSVNGTFVNNLKITPLEMKKLNHGDIVGFGLSTTSLVDKKLREAALIFEIIKVDENPVIEINDSQDDTVEISNNSLLKPKPMEVDPDSSQNADAKQKIMENVTKKFFEKEKSPCTSTDEFKQPSGPIKKEKRENVTEGLEPSVSTAPEKPGFSTENNDSCIVISDDDDDDFLACSQICQLSERIKTESAADESYDPYTEIKQELADLDYCDDNVLNKVPIDLDEGFENTNALLDFLDSPKAKNKSQKENDLYFNVLDKPQDTDLHSTSECVTAALAPEVTEETKEPDLHSTTECSTFYGSKKKYVIPPVVPPHSKNKQKPEKVRKLQIKSTEEKTKSTTKRKSTETQSASKKKKPKTSVSPSSNPCDTKSIQSELKKRNSPKCDLDAKTRDSIKNERKKRLKEISERECKKLDEEKLEKAKTLPKVRPPGGRGDFLLESGPSAVRKPAPARPLAQRRNPADYNTPGPSTSRAYNTRTVTPARNEDVVQDMTVSSNSSPDNPFSGSVQQQHTFKIPRVPQRTAEDASSLMHMNFFSRRTAVSRSEVRLDDVVTKIVNWLPKWLEEQRTSEYSPPVADQVPVEVPLRFRTFEDYCNTFNPLIMLEMWQYIYEAMCTDAKTALRVSVNHTRIVGSLLYLDCECYITEEDVRKNNIFKLEDICLVELKLKDSDSVYASINFAYVYSNCYKQLLNDDSPIAGKLAKLCPGIPHTRLKFTLVTRYVSDKEMYGNFVILKLIANVGSYFKLFKTMKNLESTNILNNILSPRIEDYRFPTENKNLMVEVNLNNEQKSIVLEACNVCTGDKPGIYCIKGPPGTGKSTVIINILLEILLGANQGQERPVILLVAPSNAAIDGLVLKLLDTKHKLSETQQKRIKQIRTGPDSSISKCIGKYKLGQLAINNLLANWIHTDEWREAAEQAVDSYAFVRRKLGNQFYYELRQTEDTLLKNSNIICTTLNSCVNIRLMDAVRKGLIKFTCCIIDEAGQCTEVESLLPTLLGIEKFILVGDPQQLPATVCNRDAKKLGYGQSMFSRIASNFKKDPRCPIKILDIQYRMREEICHFPNRRFYDNKLRSFPILRNKITPNLKPYLLFNIVEATDNSNDYVNINEVQMISNLLNTLHENINRDCRYSIGIITPYQAQRETIKQHIWNSSLKLNPNVSITVNTVDSFQGMEKDIIIISCVRMQTNNFLQNEHRLNVALTRAKQALYLIGTYSLFKHCRPLYELREDAKRRKLCLDIKDHPSNMPNLAKYIIDCSKPS